MRAWCGNLLQAWWWWLPGLLVPLLTWWPHIAQAGSGQSKDFPGGSKVFHTQEKEPGFIDYVKHKTWSRILFSSTRPNQNVHMEWWDIKGKLRDVDFTIEQPERWYIATLYQTSSFLKGKTELWLLNGDRDLGYRRQANVTIYTKYLVVWVFCPEGFVCEPPLELTTWDRIGWWVIFVLLVTLNIITCSITYHVKIKNIELKQKKGRLEPLLLSRIERAITGCCSINDSTTQLHDPQFSPESTPRILRKNSIISTSLESTPQITRRTNIKTSPEFSQKSLVRSPETSHKSNPKISSPKPNPKPKRSSNPGSPKPSCSTQPFPTKPCQNPNKKPSPIQPIPIIPSPIQPISIESSPTKFRPIQTSPIQPITIESSPTKFRPIQTSQNIEKIPNSIRKGSKDFLQANSYDHIKANSRQYIQDDKISPSVFKGLETLV